MIREIAFSGFRNLSDARISIPSTRVVLLGDNGQGKSNFIEAIHFLSFLRSFRTRNTREMIRFGSDRFGLECAAFSPSKGYPVSLRIENGLKRELYMDGAKVAGPADFLTTVKVVLFSHDDFKIASESSTLRRRFADTFLATIDSAYLDALRRYAVAHKSRNALLRRGIFASGVSETAMAYEKIMALNSIPITEKRLWFSKQLAESVNSLLSRIDIGKPMLFESSLCSRGRVASSDLEAIQRKLMENRERDAIRGMSTFGPHTDDFSFHLNGIDVRRYGSTGQRRLVALLLRMSSVEIMGGEMGLEDVVALVDDVAGELDPRIESEFHKLLDRVGQVFLTFTELSERQMWKDALILRIYEGMIT